MTNLLEEGPIDKLERRLSVAPMIDWTDRHDRYFLRLITKRALLYTEMVVAQAILHGDRDRLLGHHPSEHPLALQLGGSDPAALGEAARIGADFGYDEINLNVGCPSDKVQSGRFGACLMAEPDLVARAVETMQRVQDRPVTVKSRIGIDDQDSYDFLKAFVERVSAAGCRTFIVHARKAVLHGLSPKENREIPPLHYDYVYRLKQERTDLEIIINGGILSLDEVEAHLLHVDGAMIGRAAYQMPYILAEADRRFFGARAPAPSRKAILAGIYDYAVEECGKGTPIKSITRHILGLFHGEKGARSWRRHLSTAAIGSNAGPEVILEAYDLLREQAEAA